MKRKHCTVTDNSELSKQRKQEKQADREESMPSENEEITPNPTTPPSNHNGADDEDATAMRSLEADLHDVEQQLEGGSASASSSSSIGGLAPPRAGGSAFFHSIRSALGSIRTRLEELQDHAGALEHNPTTLDPTSTTSAVAASGLAQDNSRALLVTQQQHHGVASAASNVGERLMDRLRNAEFAHSNRIPLNMLRRQQQQEASAESSASEHSNRGRFGTKRDREEQEGGANRGTKTEDQGDSEAMDVSPTAAGGADDKSGDRSSSSPTRRVPRRMSMMVASRRRVAEVEGPQVDMDLHGTASTLLSNASIRPIGSTVEVVMESKEEEEDETSQEPEGEDVPTILLTKKSHSKLDSAQRAVLFPDTARSEASSSEAESETDKQATQKPSTVVYSWGLGANSLHSDSADIPLAAARVDSTSRAGRNDILQCGIGKFHIGCVTAGGELLMAGSNLSGEVDPNRRDETTVSKPVLLESLFQATILQVSCGAHHTAALRSNGTVLTWGSNEYGELGHRSGTKPAPAAVNVRPAVMALGPGQRATSIACGDGFTLCLTSRMKLLVCGVEDVTGFASEEARRLPLSIPALEDLPLVSIAAGRRHAVAITAHGSAYTWGNNSLGACGREYPNKFTIPIPFRFPAASATTAGKMLREPLTNWIYLEDGADQKKPNASLSDDVAVVHVTCGDDHTVMVTRAGGLLVCGNNKFGQIGFDPNQNEIVYHPQAVAHPDQKRSFKQAEAGESHTLLLDDFGDVWQMGGEEEKKVGCYQVFTAKAIQFIAAGGGQSVAVASTPTRGPLRRELSDPIVTNGGDLALADSLEEVILTIPEETDNSKIMKRAEELFRTPAVLNSLFLDPTELEDIFAKLLKVDTPNFRKSIASAIEKGMHKGLENLRSDDTRLMWPEQVRFLLLYVQCPLFVDWKTDDSVFDRRGDLILALCETILELNYEGYKALMAWATSIYPREQFVRYLVRPLLSQLKKGLSVAAGAERRPIPAIVSVLRWLYNASERDGNIAAPEDFYSDAVSNINPEELLNDLQRYKEASKHKRAAEFFFCDNPFLLSPSAKRNLLQIESELNMLKIASRGLTYNAEERTFEFNPFYILDIDRDHLLTQTLQKLSKAEPKDLRKKLRVVFKGEDGVDGTCNLAWVMFYKKVLLTSFCLLCYNIQLVA